MNYLFSCHHHLLQHTIFYRFLTFLPPSSTAFPFLTLQSFSLLLSAFFYIIYHHFSVIYFLFLYSCLPLYIWGTKCRTYRLSIKEDVVLGYRLLLRLHILWYIHYLMKSYTKMFESIAVKIIVEVCFLICTRIILVKYWTSLLVFGHYPPTSV